MGEAREQTAKGRPFRYRVGLVFTSVDEAKDRSLHQAPFCELTSTAHSPGQPFALSIDAHVPIDWAGRAVYDVVIAAGGGGSARSCGPRPHGSSRSSGRRQATLAWPLTHVESGVHSQSTRDQRFPMASVYKLPIAIEALAQVAEGKLELSRQVTLGPNDIRACCTPSRRYPRGGVTLTLGDLIELMMIESDNSAVDAVLKLVGGPAVVERRLRAASGSRTSTSIATTAQISLEMCGVREAVAESDWTLELQRRLIAAVTPADLSAARERYTTRDPRDTATPDDMAALLVRLQRGDLLPWPYGEQLIERMSHAKTGLRRLKARLPAQHRRRPQDGTTDVVINDVGIITLPESGGHLVLAVFVTNGGRGSMQRTRSRRSPRRRTNRSPANDCRHRRRRKRSRSRGTNPPISASRGSKDPPAAGPPSPRLGETGSILSIMAGGAQAFSPASRGRLTDYDLDRFPEDTLFHRLARAVCHAGCLPRKELFEAWETARRTRRLFRGGRVCLTLPADTACSPT